MENIEQQLDAFLTALEAEAIEQTSALGISRDADHWHEVVEAIMRRTVAVRRMGAVQPLSPEWDRLSFRITAAEAVIYKYVSP